MAKTKTLTFQDFVILCMDADDLVQALLRGPSPLHGRRPVNLKAAAVWYLARARGLPVTIHHLYGVYGTRGQTLVQIRRIIEKEAAKILPDPSKVGRP